MFRLQIRSNARTILGLTCFFMFLLSVPVIAATDARELAWTGDGRSLVFEAEHHGRTPLYRVDLEDGKIEHLHTHTSINGWALTPDGSSILYSRRSIGEPNEIFAVAAEGGQPTRLTHFNSELESEVDIRPAEEMWVDGDGDYKVHLFLIKPHDFDPSKKYPVIEYIYAGPQMQVVPHTFMGYNWYHRMPVGAQALAQLDFVI